jgi:hypothetical protein
MVCSVDGPKTIDHDSSTSSMSSDMDCLVVPAVFIVSLSRPLTPFMDKVVPKSRTLGRLITAASVGRAVFGGVVSRAMELVRLSRVMSFRHWSIC